MHELVDALRIAGVGDLKPKSLFRGTEVEHCDGDHDELSQAKASHEALYVTVPGADALKIWHSLRGQVEKTGYWPTLGGDAREVGKMRELLELDGKGAEQIEDCLRQAGSFDVTSWLKTRQETDDEFFGEVEEGRWPMFSKSSKETDIIGHRDPLSMKAYKEVTLILSPTTTPWAVPAYLAYGGWNECPLAHEHVAILKYWYEKFGAEIISSTFDVVELMVSRPPTTKEAALALAKEQFIYCADIVFQGTENLATLAATLLNGKTWYFWWD